MKTSVIIVTYNRLNLLKECIDCVKENYSYVDEVFVVNNNSNDGTKEYLESTMDEKIVPINLSYNVGGAGGFAHGLNYAYENSKSDYFLIMDDDTMITNKTIPSLFSAAKKLNNKFGFLSSNVRWFKNDSPSYLNTPVASKDWTDKSQMGFVKLESASFVSFFTRRDVVKKVGLPIKEMFIWADDVEYSTRISKQYPSYFVQDSIVVHKCKNNGYGDNIITCDKKRIFYYQCMFRNRAYIYRKYYGLRFLMLYMIKYYSISLLIPFKRSKYKMKRIKAIVFGITKGLFFDPNIKFPK